MVHCLDGTSTSHCRILLFFLLAFFLTAVNMLVLLQDIGVAGMLQAQVYFCIEVYNSHLLVIVECV